MVALPLAVPAACGVNEMEMVTVCLGDTEIGRLGPAKRNPVPETVTRVMLTVDLPPFVIARGWTKVLPTCTVPKFTGIAVRDCEEESRQSLCKA